jgi:hypothetical protein
VITKEEKRRNMSYNNQWQAPNDGTGWYSTNTNNAKRAATPSQQNDAAYTLDFDDASYNYGANVPQQQQQPSYYAPPPAVC